MIKGGFYLDTREFDAKLKQVTEKTIPDAAEKGIFNAGNEWIHDAKTKPPQAPFKIGDLHSRGIVEKPKKTGKEISLVVGFNISYARRHHEVQPGTFQYTLTHVSQPGPKYLESKMVKYKKDYQKIIADTIKNKDK